MKYIFNIQTTVVIDSELLKNATNKDEALTLALEGFGREIDSDIMLAHIEGE